MPWRPSQDESLNTRVPSPFFQAIETIYDNVSDTAAMPRGDWRQLQSNYITERKGHKSFDLSSAKQRLPYQFRSAPLGIAEIDILDVLYNMRRCRVALIEGWRGSGKTSLLHYVEAVVDQYSKIDPTFFIVVDGLQLADLRGRDLELEVSKDYGRAIRSSLEAARQRYSQGGALAFDAAIEALDKDASQPSVRDAFLRLQQRLSQTDRSKFVLIFDNLDHLNKTYWKVAVNLGRQITMATDFRCLVCVRPNVGDELFLGGDARAFFQYRIVVPAPDVEIWINRLGERLAKEVELSNKNPKIGDSYLTASQVKAALDRVALLLTKRKSPRVTGFQDDVSAMLEAMMADDTRHLQILFRRIVSDSRIPTDYLIGKVDAADFHPVGALLDGGQSIYSHDRYVPNLLVFDSGIGSPNFLLFHRILSLLQTQIYTSVLQLCRCLSLLGYVQETVLRALEVLGGPLLVRASHGDTINAEEPPEKVELTQAGLFYKQHMLQNADYLISIILDVPLAHEEFVQLIGQDLERVRTGRMFPARVYSMIEYTKEVSKREERQIFVQLTSSSPSQELLRVADSLRNGGLMTRSLMKALVNIAERGRSSLAPGLLSAIEKSLSELNEHVEKIEKRLDELLNRARRAPVSALPLDFTHADWGDFRLKVQSSGEDWEAIAEVPGLEGVPSNPIVVAIEAAGAESYLAISTVAVPSATSGAESFDRRPVQRANVLLPGLGVAKDARVSRVSGVEIPHPPAQTLFLAPNISYGQMQLHLHRLANGRKGEAIGPAILLSELQKICEDLVVEVNRTAGAGASRFEERIIREVGAELASKVLDRRGANTLLSLVKSCTLIVVHSPAEEFVIPWEWLCPAPICGEASEPLANGRSVVRWTGAPFDAANSLHQAQVHGRARTLRTVGLPVNGDHPWRVALEGRVEDLIEVSKSADVLHLVGHWNEREKVVEINLDEGKKMQINQRTVRAYELGTNSGALVLSICKVGNINHDSNLAAVITSTRPAAVWTPLTTIREDDVEKLDRDLAVYISKGEDIASSSGSRLSHFFNERRLRDPWTHVYVRYGL